MMLNTSMSKFGFDYFVKRGALINEMARPVSILSNLKPLQEVYIKLMNKVGPLVGQDSGKRQLFVFNYLLSNLLDIIDPDNEMDIGDYATSITGLSRGFQAVKSAFLKTAEENPEIATSPEFLQNALNDQSIQQFLTVRDARRGNRRQGYKNEVENVLGTDAQSFEQVQQQAAPLVSQLNRIMGGRKISRTVKGDASRFNQASSAPQAEENNPNIDMAYNVLDAIDNLLEYRQDYLSEVQRGMKVQSLEPQGQALVSSKTAESDLSVLKQMYEKMISDGTGTTSDEFASYIEKLSTMQGVSPERAQIFQLLLQEFEELIEFSGGLKDTQVAHGTGADAYEGYDTDVLSKILDTPEKKQLFDTWFRYNTQWRQAKNEKLESAAMRKMMQKNFFDRKGIEDEKPAYQTNFGKKQEDEESGVMNYMTEQVVRDSRTHKKGEMVERGFKKPVNYNHWLQINE